MMLVAIEKTFGPYLALLGDRLRAAWWRMRGANLGRKSRIGSGCKIDRPWRLTSGERLQLEARGGHDVNDRLGRITSPTIVGAGRYDGIAPLANSQAIVSKIAGAELRVYDGGHIFMIQDPTAFPEIIEFLAG